MIPQNNLSLPAKVGRSTGVCLHACSIKVIISLGQLSLISSISGLFPWRTQTYTCVSLTASGGKLNMVEISWTACRKTPFASRDSLSQTLTFIRLFVGENGPQHNAKTINIWFFHSCSMNGFQMLWGHIEKCAYIGLGCTLDFPLPTGLLFRQPAPVFETCYAKVCYLQDRVKNSYDGIYNPMLTIPPSWVQPCLGKRGK